MNFRLLVGLSLSILSLNVATVPCVAMESSPYYNCKINSVYKMCAYGDMENFEIFPFHLRPSADVEDQYEPTVVKVVPDVLANGASGWCDNYCNALEKLRDVTTRLSNLFGKSIFLDDGKRWNSDFITVLRYSAKNELLWTKEIENMKKRGVTLSQMAMTIAQNKGLPPSQMQHELFHFLPDSMVTEIIGAANKIPFKN